MQSITEEVLTEICSLYKKSIDELKQELYSVKDKVNHISNENIELKYKIAKYEIKSNYFN